MMILEPPVRWWHCPKCDLRDRTQKPNPHTQMHNCPALNGLGVPLVEVKNYDTNADARHIVNRSETTGALASVSTEHGSGRFDCTVFPETANISMGAN